MSSKDATQASPGMEEEQNLRKPLLDSAKEGTTGTPSGGYHTQGSFSRAEVEDHTSATPVEEGGEEGEQSNVKEAGSEDPLQHSLSTVTSQEVTSKKKRRGFSFTQSLPPPCAVADIEIPDEASPHHEVVKNMATILHNIHAGIEGGHLPELVAAGSSGSYWVYDKHATKQGIFKPKSEEPYGPANPKWSKWFHRKFCPCCFGRSCLLPNTGYVSEAAAFTMDCALDLHVVPPTQVVKLAAKTFNYNYVERKLPRLPAKIGSFQYFVKSNGSGATLKYDALSPTQKSRLVEEFQRLVVLDYMIRNTDRGLDNWLVYVTENDVKVHAIDNGLAFPFKHPDNWRTYPPSWASHELGKIPFTKSVREHVIKRIKHQNWMNTIEAKLLHIFKHDESFTESRFQGQIAVIRGQRENIISCLEQPGSSPESLFAMHPLFIVKKEQQLVGWKTHLPCFSCC